MRHDGGAEDARGQEHALAAVEARDEARRRLRPGPGLREEHLEGEAREDDAHEAGDGRLELPEAARLQRQDAERDDAGDARPPGKSGMPKIRWSPSAAPMNSARSVAIAISLGLNPEQERDGAREALAADLGRG